MVVRITAAVLKFLFTAFLLLSASAASLAPELLKLDGNITPVHDPAIIKDGNSYYLFTSGGAVRRSTDLHHWTYSDRIFRRLPAWARAEIPGVRGGYWAPDISYENGTFRLYYAVSTLGHRNSAIGLATNKTLDPMNPAYRWVDEGMVLRTYEETDDFNAIDPNLAIDQDGHEWLDFGSYWSGIKMVRIDPTTGKLFPGDRKLYSIARRPQGDHSIEAPFIVWHDPYYYLFVSFDLCCRGENSTYNIRVGRSRKITGKYVDAKGTSMMKGGGTLVMAGTSLWSGPGHQAVLLQPGGPDLLVFHAYEKVTGAPYLQISTIAWENGWPKTAPLPGEPR